jgi:hypothetical protein
LGPENSSAAVGIFDSFSSPLHSEHLIRTALQLFVVVDWYFLFFIGKGEVDGAIDFRWAATCPASFHARGTAGGDCDHRDFGWSSVASRSVGSRSRPPHELPEQFEAVGIGCFEF